jgi:hypothetical protein
MMGILTCVVVAALAVVGAASLTITAVLAWVIHRTR